MFERLKHIPIANALLRRPPGLYGVARRLLARMDEMPQAGLEKWQQEKLARVLSAAHNLPGYKNSMKGRTISQWPILKKADLLGHESDFSTGSVLPAIPAATGGTTGQPLKLTRSWRSIAFEQAAIDHLCAGCGIEPNRARIAILRGDTFKSPSDMAPPFWIDEGSRRRIFSAHHLSRQSAAQYVAALREFKPDILFCYPSSLALLVDLVGESASVNIPLIFASSEMLGANTLHRARQVFSADVIDFYGHAERIACAWSRNGDSYRFLPAYGHIELLPADEGLARIVATSLSPRGQIFVRYETGDLARVPSHDPEILRQIALGLRAFAGIEGRDGEFIELPDGRRIIGLNHIPREVAGASSIQLQKTSDREITIYVTKRPGVLLDAQTLMSNFRQKFPADIEVKFVLVERPVRERNGKAPLLLRAPDPSSIVLLPEQNPVQLEHVA